LLGPAIAAARVALVVRVVAIEAETLEVAETVSAIRGSRTILAVTIAARSVAVARVEETLAPANRAAPPALEGAVAAVVVGGAVVVVAAGGDRHGKS
jgi:hypothetical protein